MKISKIALFGAMLFAAAVTSANASLIQIDDRGENPSLYVGGVQFVDDTTTHMQAFASGTVSNFTLDLAYNPSGSTEAGERMQFRWTPSNFANYSGYSSDGVTLHRNIDPPLYTQLLAGPDDTLPISDEFVLKYASGAWDVDFISYDTTNPIMPPIYPGITPSALTAHEIPPYQDVAYLTGTSGSILDTFQVSSIPEPGTTGFGLALLGLSVGSLWRKRQCKA